MNKNTAGIAAVFLLCAGVVSSLCQAQDRDALRAGDGSPVRLVAEEPGLAIDAENRLLLAIPIANEGGRTARKVSVTAVALGESPKLAPRALPVVLGDIAPRGNARLEAAFAIGKLKSGSHLVVVIKGSYLDGRTPGTFTVRQRVTIPLRSGESVPLRSLSVKAQEGKGTPEAVRPAMEEHANEDVGPPIPTGRQRGNMKPSAPEIKVVPGAVETPRNPGVSGLLIREAEAGDDPFLFFVSTQAVLTSGGAFPDASGASSDKVVLYTSNAGLRFSTDGGLHFSGNLGLPGDTSVDGGTNGDNVVVYIPKIDRFVWFHQFRRKTNGPNRYRVAVASPKQVADSNGQAWMYFDLTSGLFGFGNDWMDYPDVAVGNKFLHFDANVLGVHGGRLVGRIPLEDLKNGGTIHIGYTDVPLQMAWGSHLAQNITNTAYVSGHNGNNTVRVYVFPESANGYTVHDVDIDSWPNDPANYTSRAPNNKEWLGADTLPGFAIIGAALKQSLCVEGKPTAGQELWLAWTAAKGGDFPQPHVQLVRINAATYGKLGQAQIWNPTLAFAYPALAVNKRNEVGVAVGLGSKDAHSTFGVSIYGEPYIYLPPVSPDASIDRYGDYFAVRRHAPNENVFSSFGLYYSLNNKKNPVCGAGADACSSNLSYIQFGRKSALTGASVPETCAKN